jgi:hypothetical protein
MNMSNDELDNFSSSSIFGALTVNLSDDLFISLNRRAEEWTMEGRENGKK